MEAINYAREYKIKAQKTAKKKESVKIYSSNCANSYIRQFYSDDISIYESCFILLLDKANNIIGWFKVSQGGIDATVVDIKLIAKVAIDACASGVILAHNHPSGNLKPSGKDTEITERLNKALKLFDVTLLDHLVITSKGYYSFADEGLL